MNDVFPHVVFTVFGIPVRDTVITTWIAMVLIMVVVRFLDMSALELLFDFLNDTISELVGRSAHTYLPLLGTLFIFISVANVIGVVPFLNAPTRDVNLPLALAAVVFFSVHYFGIRAKGLRDYLSDLASPVFLLPLEIVSQLTRTLSLTLRLFGNVISAELIVAVIFALLPVFVPLPLVGFGIFTGLLQAYIFTALSAVYIGAGLEVTDPENEAVA